MTKTILITGSTDGIGLLTAQKLAAAGHTVLLHGRSQAKLDAAAEQVGGVPAGYLADLARPHDVVAMAQAVRGEHPTIDVLINNAGVLKTPQTRTADGLDIRYVVNTVAPYVLALQLLASMPDDGRIVNLSSAAQAPVDPDVMLGRSDADDMSAYAQSKLAITIWSQVMARELDGDRVVVAVNPGSLLASKMVKEGFGVAGSDLSIGADILVAAALGDEFADASGKYFDNDAKRFAPPHAAAADADHVHMVMGLIHSTLADLGLDG